MHEDVSRSLAACQESKPANTVEPLHLSTLPVAFRLHLDVRTLRQERRMNGRALIHRKDLKGLHALRTLQHLTVHTRPFVGCLITTGPETGDVQKHVRQSIIGNDEAIPFRDIKPFDVACNLENFQAGFVEPLCSPFQRNVTDRKLRRLFSFPHFSTPRLLKSRLIDYELSASFRFPWPSPWSRRIASVECDNTIRTQAR